jgi:phenol hydroxylase P0 protein
MSHNAKHRPIGHSTPAEPDASDALERFVRVKEITANNMVEFDFAIGSPDLFAELILPKTAFDEFCERNQVKFMTDEQCAQVDLEMEKWRYGEEAFEKMRNR